MKKLEKKSTHEKVWSLSDLLVQGQRVRVATGSEFERKSYLSFLDKLHTILLK